jgi:hypothetical protein
MIPAGITRRKKIKKIGGHFGKWNAPQTTQEK